MENKFEYIEVITSNPFEEEQITLARFDITEVKNREYELDNIEAMSPPNTYLSMRGSDDKLGEFKKY